MAFLEDEDDTSETHERRITRCKECRAEIIFLPTARGSQMPVDAHTVRPDDEEFEHGRHVSHFGTCTKPEQFRKPR